MNLAILIFASAVTVAMLAKEAFDFLRVPAQEGVAIYRILADVWLVGILPVTLYPFLGGKIWCRYWCPLAKLMHLYSRWFGKFKITANDKCIACGECSRNCQVGIDVMNFANKGMPMEDPECVRCSACVQECPTGTLAFGRLRDDGSVALDRLAASPVRMREAK